MNRNSISRRDLLLGGSALAGLANAAAPKRPNILFIMVDEMRWDAMSSQHHPVVSTPNLDRLAKQGTRFTNCYSVAPVCCPARATAFTGRYADVHGVINDGMPANAGEVFLPSILKHYGYHTAISGKLHYTPAHYDYGFDQFWTFANEGPHPELGYPAYLKKKYGSPNKWASIPGTCPWPDDPLGHDVGVFKYPEADFETNWITDRSIDYLRQRKDNNQPWFLFTSYLKPHSPSVEPQPWFSKYDPNAIPIPKLPPNIKELRAREHGRGKRHLIDDEKMLRAISGVYYGAIAHVDAQVGKLLGELERLGMADDTMILFTADHGNMLGDRGRMFKGVMYEGSSHVPLLFRGPKGAAENKGRVEDKIIEATDVMPTIMETAGLPIPAGVQGRSFLKVARGEEKNWKDRAFSQLATAMVRTPGFKLIDNSRNLSGSLELYDMRNDPKEERNLVNEAKHKEMIAEFKKQLTTWRADKPAPIKVPGMPTPAYAYISAEERKNALEHLPADERRESPRKGGKRRKQ